MPNKKLITRRTVDSEISAGFMLKYYLLSRQSRSELLDEAVSGMVYGILVEKACEGNNGGLGEVEFEAVTCLTYDSNEAVELINMLANGFVTPMSLLNIVDDYITRRENDSKSLLALN